jgi:hypothetical protein
LSSLSAPAAAVGIAPTFSVDEDRVSIAEDSINSYCKDAELPSNGVIGQPSLENKTTSTVDIRWTKGMAFEYTSE